MTDQPEQNLLKGYIMELKTDVKHIIKRLDENNEQHQELREMIKENNNHVQTQIESKADREEIQGIKDKFFWGVTTLILTLITIIMFLLGIFFN